MSIKRSEVYFPNHGDLSAHGSYRNAAKSAGFTYYAWRGNLYASVYNDGQYVCDIKDLIDDTSDPFPPLPTDSTDTPADQAYNAAMREVIK